jgi:ABC-type amino acid transport system permease subunit
VLFGLPGLGIHIDEMQPAVLAMTVNPGAYATEIVRAGDATLAPPRHYKDLFHEAQS